MLNPQITAADKLFAAHQAGELTLERYLLLEKQGIAEVDIFIATLPDEDKWIKSDLLAEITKYRPRANQERKVS